MLRVLLKPVSITNYVCHYGARRLLHLDSVNCGAKPLSITSTRKLISMLTETERAVLLSELQKRCPTGEDNMPIQEPTVDRSMHRLVFLANVLPFIAFGFLDNAIMVVAGEYIDLTFASIFGLSTMAAAGLGNLISDLCGIGTIGYVERFAARCGVHLPTNLTVEQMTSRSVRWCTVLGRLTGITIGCLLGLFPLLFFSTTSPDEDLLEQTHNRPSSA